MCARLHGCVATDLCATPSSMPYPFCMHHVGIWSQVKRAPKASVKRKTFEVDGPGREGAMPMDDRARQIFSYFKVSWRIGWEEACACVSLSEGCGCRACGTNVMNACGCMCM